MIYQIMMNLRQSWPTRRILACTLCLKLVDMVIGLCSVDSSEVFEWFSYIQGVTNTLEICSERKNSDMNFTLAWFCTAPFVPRSDRLEWMTDLVSWKHSRLNPNENLDTNTRNPLCRVFCVRNICTFTVIVGLLWWPNWQLWCSFPGQILSLTPYQWRSVTISLSVSVLNFYKFDGFRNHVFKERPCTLDRHLSLVCSFNQTKLEIRRTELSFLQGTAISILRL